VKVGRVEVDRRVVRFRDAARKAGLKLTHQRLEIFREVASSLDHPDVETVFGAVTRRMPTVSLDTVYRTLWLVTDLGLISTLGPRRERVRFDANSTHHHHYICLRCGLTRDFESAELGAFRIPDRVRRFGSIVASNVEVRGVCESCRMEQADGSAVDNHKEPRGKERRRRWAGRRS